VTKLAADAGGKYTQVYNGFLFNVSARPRNGPTSSRRFSDSSSS